MKLSKVRKQALLASLVMILGIAVFVNWYYTGPDNSKKADKVVSDDSSDINTANLGDAIYVDSSDVNNEYFASAKLSRDESYDEAVAVLKQVVSASDVDADSVKTAADSISSMTERKLAQVNIENLVKAKTGSECIAVISDDSAEIIIKKSALSDDVILQIKEIVLHNTNISAEKITIIGAK